jgi:hypothetical protein
MGSEFDDWIFWHFFTITVTYNSLHIELLLNDDCLTNLYEESFTNLRLIWLSRIREWTPFYNCQAGRICHHRTVNSSSLFCLIRCSGSIPNSSPVISVIRCYETSRVYQLAAWLVEGTCLPSRCSAMDVRPGSTIPDISRHVTIWNCTNTRHKQRRPLAHFRIYLLVVMKQ